MRGAPTRRLAPVGAACLLAVGAGLGTASGSAAQPETSGQLARAVSDARSLLGGLPEQGAVLGRPGAPVTLICFGDLQSPITGLFARGALSGLIRHWVRDGTVKIEFRSLETATRDPGEFEREQAAALAAGQQRRFWYFLELFYRDQGPEDSAYATEAYLDVLARHVPGLRLGKWHADRRQGHWGRVLERDAELAAHEHIEGTPEFLVGPTGGRLKLLESSSLQSTASFDGPIRAALSG